MTFSFIYLFSLQVLCPVSLYFFLLKSFFLYISVFTFFLKIKFILNNEKFRK